MKIDAIEAQNGSLAHPPPPSPSAKKMPCREGQGDQGTTLKSNNSAILLNQAHTDGENFGSPSKTPTSRANGAAYTQGQAMSENAAGSILVGRSADQRHVDEEGGQDMGLPLSVAFADELPDTFTPPDEIVQGVLTSGDGSVLYGDSNSGKTFFVIDLACAVARGVRWMGRHTEPGLVIYLAAESPASVKSRLQAYQRHHRVKVPNFAIVQSPIDLFDGDADTDAVIDVVRQLEKRSGQKARLIVGDTLARLSAGANENAGQDMGLVIRRFDRIRTECRAHFMLIHHSGKNAAAGSRGWSGVRAAVDTEIEVTDSPSGRCAEITKQRDLSSKGQRIGFRLAIVPLGETKWGAPAASCVVEPTEAPQKATGKRKSDAGINGLKVLDVLKELCETATPSMAEWRDECGKRGLLGAKNSPEAVRKYMDRVRDRLIDDGLIQQAERRGHFVPVDAGAEVDE
jgi:KaiC/GvpD/RAD55 family RecA-like ATPase